MAGPMRTRRRSSLVGALAMTGWLVMGAFVLEAPVVARTCGQISIDDGTVSPSGGTTATTFAFSVTVSDRTGTKPSAVTVRVLGMFKPMTTVDPDVVSGQVYRASMELPAGSWSYWFRAQDARGISCDLTRVAPATITITGPAPSAETAAPTGPASSAAPSAIPTATSTAAPTPEPTPVPTGTPPAEGAGTTDDGSGSGGRPQDIQLDGLGGFATNPFSVWLVTTGGGLALFLCLVRRERNEPLAPGPVLLGSRIAEVAEPSPSDDPAPVVDRSPPRVTGRATMLPPLPPRRFEGTHNPDIQRATIGYRRVRISSKPDSVRSVERGRLERGDEVEILDSYEGYLEIRTPDGITGWILRHTIISA